MLGDGSSVPLTGDARLALRILFTFAIVPSPQTRDRWTTEIMSYFYTLHDRDDDREIVSYHWHPEGRSPVTTPHLHLGAGARIGRSQLSEAHFPTGHIVLGSFLHLAIAGLYARPLRRDWHAIVNDSAS